MVSPVKLQIPQNISGMFTVLQPIRYKMKLQKQQTTQQPEMFGFSLVFTVS